MSAKPKRFAWTLGLVMSFAMMVITNSDIHGALPRTICLICLVLMWLESVLGLCLGCEIHGCSFGAAGRQGCRVRGLSRRRLRVCAQATVAGRADRKVIDLLPEQSALTVRRRQSPASPWLSR